MKERTTVDRVWIESVVEQHERPLTIYAARLTGDVERGRDVVQDTFLKLWQVDRASVEGHLARWLYTVCRNRALDVRRKEHRMTTLDSRQMDVATNTGGSPDPGPGPSDAPEGGNRLLGFVAGLPERQQEVVRLKFQGGLSYREIAEVLDTTANNVGVLLHTAIKSIRTRIAEAVPETAASTTGSGGNISATRYPR